MEKKILSEKSFVQLLIGKFSNSHFPNKEEAQLLKTNATEVVDLIKKFPIDFIEIMKLEAIQSYLLERGANDEGINDEVLILKGLKERVNKSECKHELITSADWKYQSCSKCGFKVQIENEK